MFELLTEQTKHVFTLAREEAIGLKRHRIGTEHVLLGLLHEDHGAVLPLLRGLGVSPESVRAEVHWIWDDRAKYIRG